MAVIKDIQTTIFKYDANGQAKEIFTSLIKDTLAFPPQHVAAVMTMVTGWALEEDDWNMLNDLHTHGNTGFKFGDDGKGDWAYFVQAGVSHRE